jgi:hypothetical protein
MTKFHGVPMYEDTEIHALGGDLPAEEQDQKFKKPQKKTISGSSTLLTKGDSSKYTVANNFIGIDTAVTVLFGIGSPGTGSAVPNAYAEIRWIAGGVPVRRLVSITSGTQITGVGEYVSVQIWDATTPEDEDPYPTYPVTVLVAPGTRGSSDSPPTWLPNFPGNMTLLQPLGDPGASVLVALPQDVGIKTMQVICDDPSGVEVTFFNYLAGVIGLMPVASFGTGFVELPIQATAVGIGNQDTSAHTISVAFGVSG